jgi:hypothetical protein
MPRTPRIPALGEGDDFHDSSLIDIQLHPSLTELRVVLSTPNESGQENLWMLVLAGVLRLEFETVGSGQVRPPAPVEIYSVYRDPESEEFSRWKDRLPSVSSTQREAEDVHHIVLASSFVRGWGKNVALEGIQVICRAFHVEPAPKDYRGSELSRPRIEGSDDH